MSVDYRFDPEAPTTFPGVRVNRFTSRVPHRFKMIWTEPIQSFFRPDYPTSRIVVAATFDGDTYLLGRVTLEDYGFRVKRFGTADDGERHGTYAGALGAILDLVSTVRIDDLSRVQRSDPAILRAASRRQLQNRRETETE